jgi:hypothetical protein
VSPTARRAASKLQSMILSLAPAQALAWAAVAAYVLSALGRPPWATRAQVLALALHGLSLAVGFLVEAEAARVSASASRRCCR